MDLLQDWWKQAPAVAGVLVAMWLFLNYMTKQREDFTAMNRELTEKHLAAMKQLHQEHLDAREKSRHLIDKNLRAFEEILAAMATSNEIMRKCIDNCNLVNQK